jgi:hypothetical protein
MKKLPFVLAIAFFGSSGLVLGAGCYGGDTEADDILSEVPSVEEQYLSCSLTCAGYCPYRNQACLPVEADAGGDGGDAGDAGDAGAPKCACKEVW